MLTADVVDRDEALAAASLALEADPEDSWDRLWPQLARQGWQHKHGAYRPPRSLTFSPAATAEAMMAVYGRPDSEEAFKSKLGVRRYISALRNRRDRLRRRAALASELRLVAVGHGETRLLPTSFSLIARLGDGQDIAHWYARRKQETSSNTQSQQRVSCKGERSRSVKAMPSVLELGRLKAGELVWARIRWQGAESHRGGQRTAKHVTSGGEMTEWHPGRIFDSVFHPHCAVPVMLFDPAVGTGYSRHVCYNDCSPGRGNQIGLIKLPMSCIRVHAELENSELARLRDSTLSVLEWRALKSVGTNVAGTTAAAKARARYISATEQLLRAAGDGEGAQGHSKRALTLAVHKRGIQKNLKNRSSKFPLTVGGKAVVVMDSHSRVPMKLRHKVLQRILQDEKKNESPDKKSIENARSVESKLYAAAQSKVEYQLVCTRWFRKQTISNAGETPTMNKSQQRKEPSCTRVSIVSKFGSDEDEMQNSRRTLQPQQLLLTKAELELNDYPCCNICNAADSSVTNDLYLGGKVDDNASMTVDSMSHHLLPAGWVTARMTAAATSSVYSGNTHEAMYAIDCEMCTTATGPSLTRVSMVNETGAVMLDMLVQPDLPIIDYLTQWSGITPGMLKDVTTTLHDAQEAVLAIIDTHCILVGHSLENDLRALKLVHGRVIDTSVCFPHPRPPFKHSLKHLSEKMLDQKIQDAGNLGHDSVEDAWAAMALTNLRLQFGFDDVKIQNYKLSKQLLASRVDGVEAEVSA